MARRLWAVSILLLAAVAQAGAQQNRIDVVTPMAPECAVYGAWAIGVRTITATDRDRADVLETKAGGPVARHDRTLTLEVWYPAAAGKAPGTEYRTVSRDPSRPVILRGKAVRDAAPDTGAAPFPLVILSHGYPGNRYLLSHLGENLASKGFVVASIEHPDSTYENQKGFASTLYNRPYDQLFVLNEVDRLSRPSSGSFLAGIADASRTAIVGYSMGGYGLLNVLGAGFSDAAVAAPNAPPNRLLFERAASNPAYPKRADPRIKAAILLAPWGLPAGTWDAEALKAITTPALFVAGSADDVSGYEKGTRAAFLGATAADRYLLTFLNGSHNVAAPMPAPAEASAYSEAMKLFPFMHYADPVWDSVRSNNILQHFASVFLSIHLKGQPEMQPFLDLVPRGIDGVYSMDPEGRPRPAHTYWKGFKPRTAAGLVLEHLRPATSGQASATVALDVRVVADEPEAVLAIARKKNAGQPVTEEDWQRLFASEGYVRLKKREVSMGRPFADEDFKAFVLSEKTLSAAGAYEAQLARWKTLDARAAAALALAYLPAGTALRATIYPSIKPRENSFVFELATNPAVFFYMNAADPQPVSENVLAHELHHVGSASACDAATMKKTARYTDNTARVARMIGSFSEGLAMVAAAGGPDVHPHAKSTPEIRAGWDRDVANFELDLRKVEAFFLDVLESRLTDKVEIQKRQMAFFGFQGPWYTVGWKMAVTIERAFGRDVVVSSFCDWTTLLATYNRAARELNAKGGERLPTWSSKLVDALQ